MKRASAAVAVAGDQAEGLRQMFGQARPRFVPVVSNPHVAFGGVILERLTTAWGERGATSLVVDAGERAGAAGEMATIDLGQCIETLSPKVSFLAARGLSVRFVDSSGSTADFLHALADAAPRCDTVFVHAPAAELARLFSTRRLGFGRTARPAFADVPCPIVLADDRPASVTHAYASMKLLAASAGLIVFDLVLGAAPHSPRADRIVEKITSCAETYFAGVVRLSARIDPAGEPTAPTSEGLRRIAAARLERSAARPRGVPVTASIRPLGHAYP